MNDAEQESLSKQEGFVQMEIAFILRKNGDYMLSSCGQAGWQAGKSCC